MFHKDQFIPFDAKKCSKGIFTTLKVLDGKAFFLKEHLKRIKKHCALTKMSTLKIDGKIFKELIILNRAHTGSYRLKIIVYQNVLTIILEKENSHVRGLTLCIHPRPSNFSSLKVKMLPYNHRKQLLAFASEKKADDCLTLDQHGHILEASIANVFWVKENIFFYPDPCLSYFRGIILEQAVSLAKDLKLNIQSGKFHLKNLQHCTLFYCNSVKGILPVKKLEGIHLDPNETLINQFLDMYRVKSFSSAVDLTAL